MRNEYGQISILDNYNIQFTWMNLNRDTLDYISFAIYDVYEEF